MIFRRFYDENLAQASYLIGCPATGEALVIDPNRDADQYVRAADEYGLPITHVTETHIHADFVSGVRELAVRTGARMYLSGEGGPDWTYRFGSPSNTVLVHDGERFMVGNIEVEVIHTPGHTPEHLSFLITDTAATHEPMGVFTGDFLFVGDVGRPDLLEKAANVRGTMEQGARQLYRSLERFINIPKHVQIWPGHGAGSACGKALSAVPQSTLMYERMVNWAFTHTDENEFIEHVLAGQPEPPKYFAQMKRMNRDGPPILGGFSRPERLPESQLEKLRHEQALIVDTRRSSDYAAGHVPGTVNIPLGRSFPTWAGWLVPYDDDFYLIVDDELGTAAIDEAVRALHIIGLDRVAGYFDVRAVEDWPTGTWELATIREITSQQACDQWKNDAVVAIDVRGRSEWEAGHIPGVKNIPLGYLIERADELPRDRPVLLYCETGMRSAMGAGLLRARGLENVVSLKGGFAQWVAGGHPAERPLESLTTV